MTTEKTEQGGRLAGRVALVTGASRGLGRATAEILGAMGAQVIAVARTVGGLEALDDAITGLGGPTATLVPLDLKDGEGIDRLGAAIEQRWGRLDLFVNAAAHGGVLAPAAALAPKEAGLYAVVNYLAVLRMIRAVDPLFEAAETPAAVFVKDSVAGKPYWSGYGASKAAGEAAARSYAEEATKARVSLFEPAPMATMLRHKHFPGVAPEDLARPEDEAQRLVALLLGEEVAASGG